jgi:citrate lyase subunit alpha/citrate CoA-transferase
VIVIKKQQMKNSIGRDLPNTIEGYGKVKPFAGAFATQPTTNRHAPAIKHAQPRDVKVIDSLEEAFKRIPIRDGMTLSFHHHLRNGDGVVNAVLATAAQLGIKNLTVALSSVFPVHAPMVDHFANGVVTGLQANYVGGLVGEAVSRGALKRPVILRTHGGRARAIECGDLHIDVAFIAAPSADDEGNLTGRVGPTACGALGYAFPDAEFADRVVAITDHLVRYPLAPISIPQHRVDFVVTVPKIGESVGIVTGIKHAAEDEVRLRMAEMAAKVIDASGLMRDGLSYQAGAGGTSLAVTKFVRQMMEQRGIVGSFALGGITADLVSLLERGLFTRLLDVQCFDLEAVRSIATNAHHLEIGASQYANPFNASCAVNRLDCVILGATEIDTQFHVNVVTGSDGIIRGGSGGHSDASAGAKLSIVIATSRRGRFPIVMEHVLTATTPGESIDVLVTELGVAVNPLRNDLAVKLKDAGLPVKDIEAIRRLANERLSPPPVRTSNRIVAVVEYRDGTVIDTVRQI